MAIAPVTKSSPLDKLKSAIDYTASIDFKAVAANVHDTIVEFGHVVDQAVTIARLFIR